MDKKELRIIEQVFEVEFEIADHALRLKLGPLDSNALRAARAECELESFYGPDLNVRVFTHKDELLICYTERTINDRLFLKCECPYGTIDASVISADSRIMVAGPETLQ